MKRIGLAHVVLVLSVVKALLMVLGLGRALRMIESRLTDCTLDAEPERRTLQETARATARIAGLMPGRMECLEQSLALWYLLRRRGVAVELNFGMRQFPFTAHAWVTYRGEPLNEDPEALSKYAIFA